MLKLEEFSSIFLLVIFGILIFFPENFLNKYLYVELGNGPIIILAKVTFIELAKASAVLLFFRNIKQPDFSDISYATFSIFIGLFLVSLFNNFATTNGAFSDRGIGYLFYLLKHAGSLFIFTLTFQLDKRLSWLAVLLAITVHTGFEMVLRIMSLT